MQRFTPTRSLATGVMAVALDLYVGMLVTMPVSHIHPMIAVYVGLIVLGTGMLLRERIFPPAHAQVAAPAMANATAPMPAFATSSGDYYSAAPTQPALELVG